jgi:hypothetical protein
MIGGHVLFIIGTGKFSKILETKDSSVVMKIRITAVIAAVSCVIAIAVMWNFVIYNILNLIVWILMLVWYRALKNSTTFPVMARSGVSMLFVSSIILSIVAIGWIAVDIYMYYSEYYYWDYYFYRTDNMLEYITKILNIVGVCMLSVGWAKIKNVRHTEDEQDGFLSH